MKNNPKDVTLIGTSGVGQVVAGTEPDNTKPIVVISQNPDNPELVKKLEEMGYDDIEIITPEQAIEQKLAGDATVIVDNSPPPMDIHNGSLLPEIEHAPIQTRPKGIPFVKQDRKVGRNELCPCNSGLKFKKCCL